MTPTFISFVNVLSIQLENPPFTIKERPCWTLTLNAVTDNPRLSIQLSEHYFISLPFLVPFPASYLAPFNFPSGSSEVQCSGPSAWSFSSPLPLLFLFNTYDSSPPTLSLYPKLLWNMLFILSRKAPFLNQPYYFIFPFTWLKTDIAREHYTETI